MCCDGTQFPDPKEVLFYIPVGTSRLCSLLVISGRITQGSLLLNRMLSDPDKINLSAILLDDFADRL
jgi:hypothetical protein